MEIENPKFMINASISTIEMYNNVYFFMKLVEKDKNAIDSYDIFDAAIKILVSSVRVLEQHRSKLERPRTFPIISTRGYSENVCIT